jgi:hypothetical protein
MLISIHEHKGRRALFVEAHVDAPPIFVGHYWRTGTPELFTPNIACVDYSAPDPTGKLVAYHWQCEACLRADHFVAAECRGAVCLNGDEQAARSMES